MALGRDDCRNAEAAKGHSRLTSTSVSIGVGYPLWVRSGHVRCNLGCPLRAKSGLMHRSEKDRHSISLLAPTSSAVDLLPRSYRPRRAWISVKKYRSGNANGRDVNLICHCRLLHCEASRLWRINEILLTSTI